MADTVDVTPALPDPLTGFDRLNNIQEADFPDDFPDRVAEHPISSEVQLTPVPADELVSGGSPYSETNGSSVERILPELPQDDPHVPLVERAREGDDRAFEELILSVTPRVRGVLLQQVGTEHEADEVLQETHTRVWRYLDTFRGDARFSTWVTEIALRQLHSLKSKAHRRRETPHSMSIELDSDEIVDPISLQVNAKSLAGEDDPTLAIEEREESIADAQNVQAAMRLLPPHYRSILQLRYSQNLSHAEIAARLGIEESASKITLFRAHTRLKEVLTEPEVKVKIDNRKIFLDIIEYSRKQGFDETYWLLPTSTQHLLRIFMASGRVEVAADWLGWSDAEVVEQLTIAHELMQVGTRDYRQYAAGGESKSGSHLRAMSVYPDFFKAMHVAGLPDDTVRLASNYLATHPNDSTYNPEFSSKQVKSKFASVINVVGRSVLAKINFENRFPVRWLQTVWDLEEFQSYRESLTDRQQEVIQKVLETNSLQRATRALGEDIIDVWKVYREGMASFIHARLAAVKTRNRFDKTRQHKAYRKKGIFNLFANANDEDVVNQYIFVSRTIFPHPMDQVSQELGMSTNAAHKRLRRFSKNLPLNLRLYEKGFVGLAASNVAATESGSLREAMLANKVKPDQINGYLGEIDDMRARIFRLRYMDGLSVEETANIVGCSVKMVGQQCSRTASEIMANFYKP